MDTIKQILRENRITSNLYIKIAQLYSPIKRYRSQQHFRDNSLSILEAVQDTLSSLQEKKQFFFMFGTLLGIYRDNKLLRNDMDIDVGVYVMGDYEAILELRKHFKAKGFVLTHYYVADEMGIIQDSYDKDGIKVDVAYLKHDTDHDLCYLTYDGIKGNNVIAFPFRSIKETRMYSFNNIKVSVPLNPEQYLEDTYGKTWRVPDPNYKYWENPASIKTNLSGTLKTP